MHASVQGIKARKGTRAHRALTLDELKQRSLEEILREVVKQQEALTVRLPEGDLVAIQPAPALQPLPVLEGSMPRGWKDAVYQ